MYNNKKRGISLIVVLIILVITVLIITGVVLVVKNSNKKAKNQISTNNKVETKNSKKEKIYDSTEAYTYMDVEGGIAITEFKNYDYVEYDKIIIPDSIDGKTVVGIGKFTEGGYIVFGAVFGKCEVVIPDTVKYIGEEAFYACTGFSGTLSLPEGLKSIGREAFRNTQITEVVIPNTVTEFDHYMFANNEKLEKAIEEFRETFIKGDGQPLVAKDDSEQNHIEVEQEKIVRYASAEAEDK